MHIGYCRGCDKRRILRSRGNCGHCYMKHRISIIEGKTTWEKLEEEGKCAASKTRSERNILYPKATHRAN